MVIGPGVLKVSLRLTHHGARRKARNARVDEMIIPMICNVDKEIAADYVGLLIV